MTEGSCEGVNDGTKLGVSLGIDDGSALGSGVLGIDDGSALGGCVDGSGVGHRNAPGGSDEMEHTVSLSHSKCADTF
jgi:hypothetical protein